MSSELEALPMTNEQLVIALQDDLALINRYMIKRQVDVFEGLASRLEQAIAALSRAPMELTDSEWSDLFDAMGGALMTTATSDSVTDVAANSTLANAARQWLAERSGG